MLENLPDALGHALREQRAGIDKTAYRLLDLRGGTAALTLTSLAFADHAPIPAVYTADGPGHSPPLAWHGVPVAARSLLLIVEDADAPTPQPLVHAIAVDISPHEEGLAEGALTHPEDEGGGEGLKTGRNSYLGTRWLPPDPPPGHGAHRYAFQIFALAEGPAFSGTPGREAVLDALRERGIASGCLVGTYERPDGSVKVGEGQTAAAPVRIETLA